MRIVIVLLALIAPAFSFAKTPATAPATQPVYQTIAPSRDGIGKVYMGREIARVMGHQGADWLDRPGREKEERPAILLRDMELKPTDTVADIGAGTGYFTFRIAPIVSQAKVLAVDIQPEMLETISARAKAHEIKNVQTILGTESDPKLPPGAVDVVLMVDAYHEFAYPREMMEHILAALKPGGRVIDVEYRAEDPSVHILPHHKMAEAQAIKEMSAVGLKHLATKENLPLQHVLIFQKPSE